MENATKALLIGAGMLFAVAIVSMMIYVYLNITGYYDTKQSIMTEEQITEFNSEYEAYHRDDVTGFELVSLINKIFDYNANNTADGWEEMYISFKLKNSLDSKNLLFKETEYDTKKSKSLRDELKDMRDDVLDWEKKYGAGNLSKLVSNLDKIYNYDKTKYSSEEEAVKGELNLKMSDVPTKDIVEKYEVYINFKRAEFKCTGTDYNPSTGRIIKLTFEQK